MLEKRKQLVNRQVKQFCIYTIRLGSTAHQINQENIFWFIKVYHSYLMLEIRNEKYRYYFMNAG